MVPPEHSKKEVLNADELGIDTGDEERKKTAVLSALNDLFEERTFTKRNYLKLAGTLMYILLYFVILFLQRDPALAYQVHESLTEFVPAEADASQQLYTSLSQIFDWLQIVVFPTWNDPTCGDGVCSAPAEFPAFGRFGCRVDCGSSTANATPVHVHLETSYAQSAAPAAQRGAFLNGTTWNICLAPSSSSEDDEVAQTLCWFEDAVAFGSEQQVADADLLLPDASWVLAVNAPFGGVAGTVTLAASNGTNLTFPTQRLSTENGNAVLAVFSTSASNEDVRDNDLFPELSPDSHLDRMLDTTNRIIGGLLITQKRRPVIDCALVVDARFRALSSVCYDDSSYSNEPFGLDPMFIETSSLYNPELNVLDYYNSTEIEARGVPFGFFPTAPESFSVFLDINCNQAQAAQFITYLEDGFYFDGATAFVQADLVTFNAGMVAVSYTSVTMEFASSGNILVDAKVDTVDMNYYRTPTDFFRATLEFCFVLSLAVAVRHEVLDALKARAEKRFWAHVSSISFVIDAISFTISTAEVLFWIVLIFGVIASFETPPRFDVYANLDAEARIFQLRDSGAGLQEVITKVHQAVVMTNLNTLYIMLHGLNILFVIARFVRLCHFQVRLGIISRTLATAAADLGHYLFILAMIFLGCCVLTHLVFGPHAAEFASFGRSLMTNFNMLSFQDSSNALVFYNLPDPLNVPGLIYYWSFALVMNIMMINFALAIIVDAFSGVKASAGSSLSVPRELVSLNMYTWASFLEAIDGSVNPYKSEKDAALRIRKLLKAIESAKSVASAATLNHDVSRASMRVSLDDFKSGMLSLIGRRQSAASGKSGARSLTKFWEQTEEVAYIPVVVDGKEHQVGLNELIRILDAPATAPPASPPGSARGAPDISGGGSRVDSGEECSVPGADRVAQQEAAEALSRQLMVVFGQTKLVDERGVEVERPNSNLAHPRVSETAAGPSRLGRQKTRARLSSSAGGGEGGGEPSSNMSGVVLECLRRIENNQEQIQERLARLERQMGGSHAAGR